MSSRQFPDASFGEAWPAAVIDVGRRLAALALASVGASLGRLSVRLQARPAATLDEGLARLEFACEADAAEGSLFLDGRLIARIPGVRRL